MYIKNKWLRYILTGLGILFFSTGVIMSVVSIIYLIGILYPSIGYGILGIIGIFTGIMLCKF